VFPPRSAKGISIATTPIDEGVLSRMGDGGGGHFDVPCEEQVVEAIPFLFLFLPPSVGALEEPDAPTTFGLPAAIVSMIPLHLSRALAWNAARTSPTWGAS